MTKERRERLESVLDKRQNSLTVILENVFDKHNVSAVLRSCDAVGVQEIYVVHTKAPRLEKWGYRSSGSAYKWLTVHQFTNLESCIAAVRKKYDRILTTHLSADAVSLYDADLTQKIALVFGNEHSGVSDELIAKADGNFIVPQVGIIKSLNISVACAVCLYEAYRQKDAAGHYNLPQLNDLERNEISKQWGLHDET